ncbi:MAG: N-acetylmuramoyl-L-alanine amidase [Lachnospiraceae bacterium]|nr:N-acetylmuramoyl-L-alanine amidase [Lachnospiraceae bacterium]
MPHIFSKKPFFIIVTCILILTTALFFLINPIIQSHIEEKQATTQNSSKYCIVLDAGHGANDPGKIGINNVLEKDINLSIVLKLKPLLENKGFYVVLTRDSDKILASEDSSSIKRDDMIARVNLIKETSPILTVSIHQNSFTDSSSKGPQVFYYTSSTESKALADNMQNRMNQILSPEKERTPQKNDSYYLLKNSPTPIIIAECGFLSNSYEADLLTTELYQLKVARSVYFGIIDYCKTNHLIPIS